MSDEIYGIDPGSKMKDAHSPSGQSFFAPPNLANLPDCPYCHFGTPIQFREKIRCIDCGKIIKHHKDND